MSRTYEDLKTVERGLDNGGHPRIGLHGRVSSDAVGDRETSLQVRYERLRVWMANQGPNGSGVRVVMVTACRSGSGTTTTVAGLGAALSDQPTTRVLLVDANLRTPGLDRIYGTGKTSGFSELLTKPDSNGDLPVHTTRRANVFLMGTGMLTRSPVGIFDRSAIKRAVDAFKTRFDFVVFDAAPLLEFPEGYALAPHVDAVLLVLDAQKTSLNDARRAVRDLEAAGGRAAGIVLNRERDYMPRLLRRVIGGAR